VDPRTREHLDLAERNRNLAQELLGLAVSGTLRAPAYEWIAVIAFYSAVHYVDAYFWEILQRSTTSHPQRAAWVKQEKDLRACAGEFQRLWALGTDGRYTRGFVLLRSDAEYLVNIDLKAVETLVMAAL